MARAAINMPSITACGSPSSTDPSINAPGSPSSPLQMMYFTSDCTLRVRSHFSPVGKPAPPRPRRPLASISLQISSALIVSALRSALIAVARNIVVQLLRIHLAVVLQHRVHLHGEEGIAQVQSVAFQIAARLLDLLALQHRNHHLVDDRSRHLRLDVGEENVLLRLRRSCAPAVPCCTAPCIHCRSPAPWLRAVWP